MPLSLPQRLSSSSSSSVFNMAGWRRLLQPIILKRQTINISARVLHRKSTGLFLSASANSEESSRTYGYSGLSNELFCSVLVRHIHAAKGPLHSPNGKEEPVRSPLTMVPSPSKDDKTDIKKPQVLVEEKRPVRAVLKKIKQSPKKVNLVAALVRGMRVEDAILQLKVLKKRAAKTVKRVVANARANATHNHNLNGDKLFVAEAFVGKGKYLKRISYHAKGRSGIMHHPSCRLTVIVQEMSDEQEAELARYKTMHFKERAKIRNKLIPPHTLIEVTSHWHRKPKKQPSPEETDVTN